MFTPDLSSSSLVLLSGWVICTKMWLFLGIIFSLGVLIPGKLSLKLQYDGWVWMEYDEELLMQWNYQELCKNNNNNCELKTWR